MRTIKEKENKIDWDKKICLEVSLRELQCFYDCIGMTNESKADEEWNLKNTTEKIPYATYQVYDDLESIITQEGGILD